MKDISVTFEASVEETLEDIKASVEVFKELKSLASEFGNLFAQLEEKRTEKRTNDYDSIYNMAKDRIAEVRDDVKHEMNLVKDENKKISAKMDSIKSDFDANLNLLVQKVDNFTK